MHERLAFPRALRPIIHGYTGEVFAADLTAYDLHEVAAEKVRSFLQASKHLREKKWLNPRARDLYDLWWIETQQTTESIDWKRVVAALPEKVKDVGVQFESVEDFLDADVLAGYERVWSERLERLLAGGKAPPFADARATFEGILTKMGL